MSFVLCAANLTCSKHRRVPQPGESDGTVIAKIDDSPVTAGDLMRAGFGAGQVGRPGDRSQEGQRRLLDSFIRFEVMAREAKDKGYDQDPEVIRAMKQQMINQLVKTALDAKVADPSEASIQQYHAEHTQEFGQRPLSEVRQQIQQRLASMERARKMDEWTAQTMAKHKVQIFEDKLKDIDLPAGPEPVRR